MTREGRKTVDICGLALWETGSGKYSVSPFLSILVNNIELEGEAVKDTPPQYIVYTLATRGGIAYLKDINEWTAFNTVGKRDRYNLPRKVRLYNNDGYLSEAVNVSNDIYIFPANAEYYPPVNEIKKRVFRLNELDLNIHQNLNVLRQATAVVTDDEDLSTQVQRANKEREEGATTVTLVKKPGAELGIENFTPAAQSHLLEYAELEKEAYTQLNEIVGVANVGEKNERRIESEINLISESSGAIIDTLVSSINKWAEWYGIDVHARRRLSTAPTAERKEEKPAEGEEEGENVPAETDSK